MKRILLTIILIGVVGCSKSTSEDNPIASHNKKACENGNSEACFILAVMYEDGRLGLSRDLVKAKSLMRKACAGGWEEACSTEKSIYWKELK